jgi:multidrug efflux system outer membrane protein
MKPVTKPFPTALLPTLLLLGAGSMLGGCNLAPKYVRPMAAVPAALPQGGTYPTAASDAPDISQIGWRDFFIDARLQQVIETGLKNNQDLRLAMANVLQARAQFRTQRASQLPAVNASGSGTYTNNASTTALAGGAGGSPVDIQYFSGSAGMSAYEIDLFGRLRNLTKAAQEQFLASQEAQRAARVLLIGELASNWLTLAADREQLKTSQAVFKAYEQTYELTRAKFTIGTSSELEMRQAETNYQSARNDIAVRQTQIAQDINALQLLTGATLSPDLLPDGLQETPYTIASLPGQISSQVLLHRPDVLQAEHQMIAQNANIGAARAAFFPQISLTATIGTISPTLANAFGAGTGTYNVTPTATLPIFNFGKNQANLAYARAAQEGAVATYQKTIQTAFREVADALAARGTMDEQMAAQTARAKSAQLAAKLSDARYRAGVDSFLVALDSQRTAYAAQQQLVATRLGQANNLVALYRTLGGGLN